MNKDSKEIAKTYKKVLESVDITNNMTTGVSTKYYPIHDMDEEEMYKSNKDRVLKKLEANFSKIKSLIDSCNKNCTLLTVSELCDLLNSPELKTDLNNLKMTLQEDNVKNGNNSKLSLS